LKPCGQGPLNLGKPAQAGMRAHIQGYVATHSGRVAATQTEPRVAQRYDRLVAVLQRPLKGMQSGKGTLGGSRWVEGSEALKVTSCTLGVTEYSPSLPVRLSTSLGYKDDHPR